MGSSPIFTEVIDVTLNSDSLEASLTKLVETYKSKLAELNEAGIDSNTISPLNVAAITDDLTKVRAELKTLTEAFIDAFGTVAAAGSTSSAEITQNFTQAAKEVDAAASASSKYQLDQLALVARTSEEAYAQFATAASAALDDRINPATLRVKNTQKELFDYIRTGGIDAFEALDAAQQQWAVKYAQEIQQAFAASNRAYAEDVASYLAAVREKIQADRLGSDAVSVAARERKEQEQLGAEISAINKRRRAEEEQLGNDIVAITRRTEKEQRDAEAARLRAIREERAEQEKLGNDIIAITRRTEQERKRVEAEAANSAKAAQKSQPFGARFADEVGTQIEKFPEMLAQQAAYGAAWGVIGTTITAVVTALHQVTNEIKDGYEYLTHLEEKAADLQGVLASVTKLSESPAENFKLAGQAAVELVQHFEDASIKYGIQFDTLERGFKSFADAGGVSLTKNLKEAQDVTVLFAAALKGAGKDADATRSMLAEYPKLLDGTIGPSSKVLQTLGLTADQWRQILSASREHHDLLERITPYLQSYISVAEQASQRQDALAESAKLTLDRTIAMAAKPLWDGVTDSLKEINKWLEDNKGVLQSYGAVFSDLFAHITAIVSAVEHWAATNPIVQGGIRLIASEVVSLAATFSTVLSVIERVVNVLAGFQNIVVKRDITTSLKSAIDDFTQYAQDQFRQIPVDVERTFDKVADAIKGRSQKAAASALEAYGSAGGRETHDNTKSTRDALDSLRNEFQEQLQAEEELHRVRSQSIELERVARKKSDQEAFEEQTRLAVEAHDKQIKLIDDYRSKASSISAPTSSRLSFDRSLNDREHQVNDQFYSQIFENQKKGIQDGLRKEEDGYAQSVRLAQKNSSQQIGIIEQRIKAGLVAESAGSNQELSIIKETHAAVLSFLQAELTAAGANEERQKAVRAAIEQEDQAYTAALQANADRRTAALLKEAIAVDQTASKRLHAENEALEASAVANQRYNDTAQERLVIADRLAKASLAVATIDLAMARAEVERAKSAGESGEALEKLVQKEQELEKAKAKAAKASGAAQYDLDNSDPLAASLSLAHDDWAKLFNDFTHGLDSFGTDLARTLRDVTGAIDAAGKAASDIVHGIESGGIAGGIGAGLSDAGNTLSAGIKGLFESHPVIGALTSAVGGVVSAISGLFTAAARHIAEDIKKQFDKTMQAYQNGAATLQQTLQEVQAERASAIAQLSGKKGGQDQLDKLLPTLDAEIAQLQQQQKQIIDNFDTSLQKLKLHSDVLSETLDQWKSINEQVKEYIDAGGDAAAAQEYLSLSLEKMKEDAADQLQSGESDAIDKALQLNDLLKQRQQLIDDYNKSRFDNLNADALERRTSYGVDVGIKQSQADKDFQDQLSDLNQQIDLANQEVQAYQTIYQLSSDTATLKKEASQIELDNLLKQIAALKDYQSIYNSIYKNPSGTYSAQTSNVTNNLGTINVTVNGNSQVDGKELAQTIQSELERNGRYGIGTVFTTS